MKQYEWARMAFGFAFFGTIMAGFQLWPGVILCVFIAVAALVKWMQT